MNQLINHQFKLFLHLNDDMNINRFIIQILLQVYLMELYYILEQLVLLLAYYPQK